MGKKIIQLLPDNCYHVFNRGINGEDIFKERKNYSYFLKLYAWYISPIAHTYAYSLLKNHFHFAIKIKTKQELSPLLKRNKSMEFTTSHQFSLLFSSYAQAINKAYNRTGGLFESPFKRNLVENENYLLNLIHYIHFNPQHHGFVADYKEYEYSSYSSFLSGLPTQLSREEVLSLYGGVENFKTIHKKHPDLNFMQPIIFE